MTDLFQFSFAFIKIISITQIVTEIYIILLNILVKRKECNFLEREFDRNIDLNETYFLTYTDNCRVLMFRAFSNG